MKPTRLTQPYRVSGSRPPGPVLDAMRLGRAAASPGAALAMRAQTVANAPRGPGRKRKGVRIPRASSPRGRNIRAQWPARTQH